MQYSLGISSISLGRGHAGHQLEEKLRLAEEYGYEGVEIFYEDVVDIARRWSLEEDIPPEYQIAAAQYIHGLCAQHGLRVICLQPFAQFEGLMDRSAHRCRLRQLVFWFDLAHELDTDMIAIASTFLPVDEVSDNYGLIIDDLREAADLAGQASPPIRLSFESLCWGTRVDDWETCYEIITKVDRPNFGMCLDTFNIAGRIYADPASFTGKVPNAEEAVRRSMARLIAQVDVSKVFYVQVVDAERLSAPLVPGHPFYVPDQPARMSWSRNCRLFYGEEDRGAYLPIRGIVWACLKGLGYQGWVSMELYNRYMNERAAEVPEDLAQRGAAAWRKLVADLQLESGQNVSFRSTPDSL